MYSVLGGRCKRSNGTENKTQVPGSSLSETNSSTACRRLYVLTNLLWSIYRYLIADRRGDDEKGKVFTRKEGHKENPDGTKNIVFS